MNHLPATQRQSQPYETGQTTRYLPEPYQQQPLTGPVHLAADREAVIYVPSATDPNVMVAIPKQYLQPATPMPARDLTPAPLIDPQAQRVLAAGVGLGAAGAGIGYGVGQMLAGVALMTGSGIAILAALLLAATAGRSGARGGTTIRKETHVHQKWLGKTTINQ